MTIASQLCFGLNIVVLARTAHLCSKLQPLGKQQCRNQVVVLSMAAKSKIVLDAILQLLFFFKEQLSFYKALNKITVLATIMLTIKIKTLANKDQAFSLTWHPWYRVLILLYTTLQFYA